MAKCVFYLLLWTVVACSSAVSVDIEKDVMYTEVDKIVRHILTLKNSVDESAKEQWDALQSLRFHLLSTRTGLKVALQAIEELKLEVQNCKLAAVTQPTPSEEPIELRIVVPETLPCQWPASRVGTRCLVLVTDDLKSWDDAQQHCRSLGGSLAGEHDLRSLQAHLTELFGINSPARVRWSIWSGAQQAMTGKWNWSSNNCNLTEVNDDIWAPNQPHLSTDVEFPLNCVALNGFNEYRGVTVPCLALRRFACDIH